MSNAIAWLVGVAMVASPLGAALAQDCPRGELDKAYCDRNGDLVADAPTDPKQFVNPSTLIFAYTPVEDPAVYAKTWDGFIKHMEKTTAKKVVFFPVQSNAAQIEAMRSGRLHVAGFNTGSVPIAVNCAGFVPFAIMGTHVDIEEGANKVVVGVHALKPGDYEIYTFGTFGFNGAVGYPSGEFSLPFSIKPGETTYIGNFDSRPGAFTISFVVTDRHERDMAIARRKEASLPAAVTMAVPDVARIGSPYFRPN